MNEEIKKIYEGQITEVDSVMNERKKLLEQTNSQIQNLQQQLAQAQLQQVGLNHRINELEGLKKNIQDKVNSIKE